MSSFTVCTFVEINVVSDSATDPLEKLKILCELLISWGGDTAFPLHMSLMPLASWLSALTQNVPPRSVL